MPAASYAVLFASSSVSDSQEIGKPGFESYYIIYRRKYGLVLCLLVAIPARGQLQTGPGKKEIKKKT